MKKIAMIVAMAAFLSSSMPGFAAPAGSQEEQKNQCLLNSKNCAAQADSIQRRVKKLNQEIEKGTRVYTPEELNKLEQKLKEAENILDTLEQDTGK